MKIVDGQITLAELKQMAKDRFGNFVKAVVDVKNGIMVLDAELHADEEALLMEQGSRQPDLWGINIYPDLAGAERIEFDSMINLKPGQGNMTRSVEGQEIRDRITAIVTKLVN